MQTEFSEADVRKDIKTRVDSVGLRVTARRLNISSSYLSDIIHYRRGVSRQIAKKLGYVREVVTVVIFRKEGK
jgi:hypothetical protein